MSTEQLKKRQNILIRNSNMHIFNENFKYLWLFVLELHQKKQNLCCLRKNVCFSSICFPSIIFKNTVNNLLYTPSQYQLDSIFYQKPPPELKI